MIKIYKNTITNIKAVRQNDGSFKVIDGTEDIDTPNIVMFLTADQVTNSKYWKVDMEEPEGVEVLSLTNKYNLSSEGLWIRTDKGFTWNTWKSADRFYSVKDLLSNDGINKIYSVKRLSDGVVFTVGDKVCWDWSSNTTEYYTIKGFTMEDDNTITVQMTCGYNYSNPFEEEDIKRFNFRLYIEKKVVFISEDGVDMHVGDTYHYVYKGKSYDTICTNEVIDAEYSNTIFMRFSTRETCQEYLNSLRLDELVDVKLTKKQVVKLKELLK